MGFLSSSPNDLLYLQLVLLSESQMHLQTADSPQKIHTVDSTRSQFLVSFEAASEPTELVSLKEGPGDELSSPAAFRFLLWLFGQWCS